MRAPSSYGAIDLVLALIQNLPEVGDPIACPSEDELAEAYDIYNARFQKTFQQMKKQEKGKKWPWSR